MQFIYNILLFFKHINFDITNNINKLVKIQIKIN
jgi:hypothetical protein